MSDDSQYIKSIQDFILNLLSSHVNEKEKAEFQIKTLMRYSILEKILSKFIFRYRSQDYDMYNILLYMKEHTESEGSDGVFEALKTMFEEVHKELEKTDALYFYGKLMKEILKFPKKLQQKNFNFSQEDAEEKVESMLKDHIELNFCQLHDSTKKIDDQYFNDNYVKQTTDKLHFEYSVCSLTTMFKILETFEKQSLICKDPELITTSEDGMVCEKKLFSYLDKMNKEIKFTPKNLIDYMIQSHIARITQELYDMDSVVNNYEIENNLCFSLFLLKKLIKDYSFYFDKKPELERIFLSLKKFKDWPLPVGNFGMQLYEEIINELYFQGVTIMNELRKTFFLDLIDPNISTIETKYFNSVILVYCPEDDKAHFIKEMNQGVDENNRQDLPRILQHFCNKKRKYDQISLREFMVKIFLTIVRNSNESYNYSILDNIIKKFMTTKKSEYNHDFTNNNMENEEEIDREKIEMEMNRKKSAEDNNTRQCIETLFKIIDVGLDKSYDDFLEDITMLAQPIVKITENFNMMANVEVKNSPITEYRYFLKPHFQEKKKISILQYSYDDYILGNDKSDYLNLYESYKQQFTQVYFTYFSHLSASGNDIDIDLLEKKRQNFYRDYRMKLVLIEDFRVLSSFIDNLHHFYKKTVHEDKFEEDFAYTWSKFMKDKEDFEINYVLYLLPQINNYKEIYNVSNASKNEKPDDLLLSEFISNNDTIYRSNIFLPWAIPRENDLTDYFTKMNENIGNGGGDFLGPTPDTLYSFLKQPLNLYLTEAEHIFNLNLFKVTIEQGNYRREKIFWKSIDIQLNAPKKIVEQRNKKGDSSVISTCNMSMLCVDLLGVHYKDKDKEKKVTNVLLNDPIQIKIFNIFFRKDAPFNFNMNSNNGWLEVFAWGKLHNMDNIFYYFIFHLLDNFVVDNQKNFYKTINTNSKSNYFDDFVVPQFELDSTFKNFKATSIDICPNESVVIKIDDLTEINSKDFRNSENSFEQLHIKIEKYERNGKHVSIPIATFMPI